MPKSWCACMRVCLGQQRLRWIHMKYGVSYAGLVCIDEKPSTPSHHSKESAHQVMIRSVMSEVKKLEYRLSRQAAQPLYHSDFTFRVKESLSHSPCKLHSIEPYVWTWLTRLANWTKFFAIAPRTSNCIPHVLNQNLATCQMKTVPTQSYVLPSLTLPTSHPPHRPSGNCIGSDRDTYCLSFLLL
jgi:hypothetical protein